MFSNLNLKCFDMNMKMYQRSGVDGQNEVHQSLHRQPTEVFILLKQILTSTRCSSISDALPHDDFLQRQAILVLFLYRGFNLHTGAQRLSRGQPDTPSKLIPSPVVSSPFYDPFEWEWFTVPTSESLAVTCIYSFLAPPCIAVACPRLSI